MIYQRNTKALLQTPPKLKGIAMNEYDELRTAAKRAGFLLRKSRRKTKTENNLCGYMLLDQIRRSCVYGSRWELAAEDVLNICKIQMPAMQKNGKFEASLALH